jgi:hypothetical protein
LGPKIETLSSMLEELTMWMPAHLATLLLDYLVPKVEDWDHCHWRFDVETQILLPECQRFVTRRFDQDDYAHEDSKDVLLARHTERFCNGYSCHVVYDLESGAVFSVQRRDLDQPVFNNLVFWEGRASRTCPGAENRMFLVAREIKFNHRPKIELTADLPSPLDLSRVVTSFRPRALDVVACRPPRAQLALET